MAFRWHADDGPTLIAGLVYSSFVIFQGIRTSIAKKPFMFVIFQGGGEGVRTSIAKNPYMFVNISGGGGPDPLSPLWICTCQSKEEGKDQKSILTFFQ